MLDRRIKTGLQFFSWNTPPEKKMSHIKPLSPKAGFDENGVYTLPYDPKYLEPRYAHLTEAQKEAAQWEDDFRNECRQGGR
jgi:hypothetical protein